MNCCRLRPGEVLCHCWTGPYSCQPSMEHCYEEFRRGNGRCSRNEKEMTLQMSPKHQRHYWSSSGQKLFKISLTGRLGTATFHWHILFKRNPLHLQLHHPSLWVNLIQSNMDPLSLSSLHEHHTLKLYFMTTIPTSITSLRKQHEVLHMLPLSSLSNKRRMERSMGCPYQPVCWK